MAQAVTDQVRLELFITCESAQDRMWGLGRDGQEERRPDHGVGGDGGMGSSSWQGRLRKFISRDGGGAGEGMYGDFWGLASLE